jgi:hypothetical protein
MGVYDPQLGGNTHLDVILSNISVAFPNNGLVGNMLYPMVNVRRQSDKYYVFGREAWGVEPGGDFRAPGSVANEIPGLAVSTDTYFAKEHSLQIPVTDEEIAMQTQATTAANYATGYSVTNAGGTQWSDYVNSDPIGQIKTARRKIHSGLFFEPNVGIFPYQVMSVLEDHPDFIERIKYSERGIITSEIMAALFGIGQIIVPGVGYNSANPGQTAALGYLWGKDVVLAYVPPRAGLRIPAFGYEFNWGYQGSRPMVTERWREEPRKSDLIRVSRRYDLKMVALDGTGKEIAGYVIKAAVA